MGLLMEAEVAIPPSPVEDSDPVPATVATRYDGGTAETWTQRTERKTKRDEAKPTRKNIKLFM
jgi:hypothetical protein